MGRQHSTLCLSMIKINLKLQTFLVLPQLLLIAHWLVFKIRQCCNSIKEVDSNTTDWAQKRDELEESHVGIFRY